MPIVPDAAQDRTDRRRGFIALVAALAVVAVALSSGLTGGSGAAGASGAAAWVARERPAGPVLTLDGWGGVVADGDRLRILTASDDDLVDLAFSADPGSVVVPSDAPAIDDLRSSGQWTVTYRDQVATVLVHEGALPVAGAT